MKPTPTQIIAEAKILETIKPRVPQKSSFSLDNHAAIDAQIIVLEDGMEKRDIEKKRTSGEWSIYTASEANDAMLWMNGDMEESPSTGWMLLIK